MITPDTLIDDADIDIFMSVRVRHVCRWHDIKTVGQLVAKSDHELLLMPNFGSTSLREVRRLRLVLKWIEQAKKGQP